jgi:hypothetical protein
MKKPRVAFSLFSLVFICSTLLLDNFTNKTSMKDLLTNMYSFPTCNSDTWSLLIMKDIVAIIILLVSLIFLVIIPIGRLTILENKVRISLISLYDRARIENKLTESMKKNFLTHWKHIIQPKTNKMKVYRIYLITHLSLPCLILFSLKSTEISLLVFREMRKFIVTLPMFIKLLFNIFDVVSQDFSIFIIRFIQELLIIKIASIVLQSFSDYRSFILKNKRIYLVKGLCYITLFNLRTLLRYPKSCEFGLLLKIILFLFSVFFLLVDFNVKNHPLVNKINHVIYNIF